MADTLSISLGFGKVLQVLVENQGRINFKVADDFKGIIGDVLLNNVPLKNWTITGFPFEDLTKLENLMQQDLTETETGKKIKTSGMLLNGPVIYHGKFDVKHDVISDTYINTNNWGKVHMRKRNI